uniref:STAS domain-containing protein n=1 Tax=Ciona savignyi TaxID=51511 RepID=H2ZI96_CIOSA
MNSRGSMFKSPNGDVFINGLDTGDSLKHVIIDMTSCSFVDNDTVKTFSSLYSDLRKLEIAMYLAACTKEVRKCFQAGSFPPADGDSPEGVSPEVFFISVQAAVAYAGCDDVIERGHETTQM